MTDITAGGPLNIIKGQQCDTCLSGQDITPIEVTSPSGRTFTVPKCFAGVLDYRTGIPLSPCRNCTGWRT